MNALRIALLSFLVLAFAACASAPERAPKPGHAQCLVCKSEGDLACVDVTIAADTPRTEWRGATYWFCSESCRRDFEKDPEAYLAR